MKERCTTWRRADSFYHVDNEVPRPKSDMLVACLGPSGFHDLRRSFSNSMLAQNITVRSDLSWSMCNGFRRLCHCDGLDTPLVTAER